MKRYKLTWDSLDEHQDGNYVLFSEADAIEKENEILRESNKTAHARIRELESHLPFEARCPECGWFGMSDDCKYMRCPNCGGRVMQKK